MQEQSGIFGFLSSPVGQGLLAGGLGALASRGSVTQAIGKGGLLGLSAMGQAQANEQNRLLDAAKMKMEQAKFDREQQKHDQMQGMLSSVFGGQSQGVAGTGGTGGTNGGGLAGASVDQIAAMEALGGPKLLDHWKLAQTGVAQDGGKFYTRNGQMQYLPKVGENMAYDVNAGRAAYIPGHIQAQAQLKGAEAQAVEAAKYPFTVGADRERQQTAAGLDAMQVTGPDGSSYFVPRSQVVGGGQGGAQGSGGPSQPFMASRNPVSVATDQKLNDDWIANSFRPTVDAASGARGVLASVQALRNLDLNTGWGTGAMAAGANVLSGLGIGGEEAQKLASNAQVFQNVAMDRLQVALAAQKGPQTDSDAKRIEKTWVALQNTPQANEFILDFAEAQARQQARKAAFYQKAMDVARKTTGDLTEVDRRWQELSGSVWSDPALAKWQKQE